jgi:hypothetical protein
MCFFIVVFLAAGFAALGTLIQKVFTINFKVGAAEGKAAILEALDLTGRGAAHDWAVAARKNAETLVKSGAYWQGEAVKEASAAVKEAMGKFRVPEDSPLIGDLKDQLEELNALQEELALEQNIDRTRKLGAGINNNLVKPLKAAHHEAQQTNAVLFGSAEHIARLAEFRERLQANVAGGAGTTGEEQVGLLGEIVGRLDGLLDEAKKPSLKIDTSGLA